MKPCPFCGLVDDHDDKCYFTLKAAGAMSGDLQRAWDRRAAPDSHVIPPTRGTGKDANLPRDEIARVAGSCMETGHYSLFMGKIDAAIGAHTNKESTK